DVHQADLNYANEHVRQEIYRMINYWIKQGVEGFRLDVIDLIGKDVDTGELSCTPKFYEYLQELHENTFQNHYLTVGECWGATPQQAMKICNGKGLTQVFHFNHLTLTQHGSKWNQKKLELHKLASILETWQNEYQGIEAIVMNNHDLPRLLSLWLDDQKYRKESAMLLAMLFGMLRGNLYIYQGEEYGMTSAHFTRIDQYRDIETINYYHEQLKQGVCESDILEVLAKISRDNGRVPMQFMNTLGHGFTSTTPWISFIQGGEDIYPDQTDCQVIYQMYQKIIQYRKGFEQELEHPIHFHVQDDILTFTRGSYHGIFNFSDHVYPLPEVGEVIFHNYLDTAKYLRAYEAYIYQK
ncbi:MAG: hypothetical protein IJP28_06975, partial [Erysipelotrichales bacterium]|nr:hypothetical protein [Erysipelotrichales bacterium]